MTDDRKSLPQISASESDYWTVPKGKAACVLAGGGTQKEAAEEAEVTDRTIRNWLLEPEFAAEVDRLTLMVGISSRAERLRVAMRVLKQKTQGNEVATDRDVLDWLKFAQSETDGIKLDLSKVAAAFSANEASVADRGSTGSTSPHSSGSESQSETTH